MFFLIFILYLNSLFITGIHFLIVECFIQQFFKPLNEKHSFEGFKNKPENLVIQHLLLTGSLEIVDVIVLSLMFL